MSSTRRQDVGLGKTPAGGSGGSFAVHNRDAPTSPAASHPTVGTRHEASASPHHEEDHNQNPILVAFREAVDTGEGDVRAEATWWFRQGVNDFVALSPSYIAPSQMAYARKELARLAGRAQT